MIILGKAFYWLPKEKILLKHLSLSCSLFLSLSLLPPADCVIIMAVSDWATGYGQPLGVQINARTFHSPNIERVQELIFPITKKRR